MRAMSFLFFAWAAAVMPAAQASPDLPPTERQLREACSFDAAGVRECLQKRLADSETTLRSAEVALKERLSTWDVEPKYAALAKNRATEAASSFARYRKVQCGFSASLGGSAIGNALEMRRLACAAELNLQRAQALRAAAAELAP